MTFRILVILLLAVSTILDARQSKSSNELDSNWDWNIAVAQLKVAGATFQKELELRPCGMGIGMGGGPIKSLSLPLQASSPFEKNEARKLIVHCELQFLEMVNNNKEIRPLLEYWPADTWLARVAIAFPKRRSPNTQDRVLTMVAIYGDRTDFSYEELVDGKAVYSEEREPFSESVRIVREQEAQAAKGLPLPQANSG